MFNREEAEAPYQCAHTILKSHARAYRMYYEEFFASQLGQVGITIDSGWYEPKNVSNPEDHEAAERALKFKVLANFGKNDKRYLNVFRCLLAWMVRISRILRSLPG